MSGDTKWYLTHLWVAAPTVLVFTWRLATGKSLIGSLLDGLTFGSALWLLTMWGVLAATDSLLGAGVIACVAATFALYPVLRRRPWTHAVGWAVVGPIWLAVIWTLSLGVPLAFTQYKYGVVCAKRTAEEARTAAWPLASRVRSREQFIREAEYVIGFVEMIEDENGPVTIVEYGIPRTWFTFHGFTSNGRLVSCFPTYE